MKDFFCIRGAGTLCKKAIIEINHNMIEYEIVYIADKYPEKYEKEIEKIPVIDAKKAISIYRGGGYVNL